MAEGYKDFTAGAILTAADLEDYCESQGGMRFASAAARDAALSVVKTEGMFAFLKDLNVWTVYSGAAWSTVGPVHGALTVWTPAVVQSVSVTTTNTQSWYQRIGRLVVGSFSLAVTGAGTAANFVSITSPVTMTTTGGSESVGTGYITDVSAGLIYPSFLLVASSTTFKLYSTQNATAPANVLQGSGINFNAGLASGDIVSGSFAFQAAADA